MDTSTSILIGIFERTYNKALMAISNARGSHFSFDLS